MGNDYCYKLEKKKHNFLPLIVTDGQKYEKNLCEPDNNPFLHLSCSCIGTDHLEKFHQAVQLIHTSYFIMSVIQEKSLL